VPQCHRQCARMLALLLLLCTSTAAAANVTIVVGAGSGGVGVRAADEPPPAWFLAARAEDRSERARERAEDKATMSAVQATLSEVADAVVTRTVAARVDQCAPSTALLVFAELSSGFYKHASAVPMFGAGGASSSYLLSSAHLFPPDATGKMLADYAGARHTCALAANFLRDPSPLDLAIVHCASGIAVPPSNLSATAYRPHLPAAMLGFSEGFHVNPGLCSGTVLLMAQTCTLPRTCALRAWPPPFRLPPPTLPRGPLRPWTASPCSTARPQQRWKPPRASWMAHQSRA
jgi:hypothetical protein